MPFERLRLSASPSDCDVSDESPHAYYSASPPDTVEGSVDRHPLRVYVISAKLEPSALDDLVNLVEKHVSQRGGKVDVQILELTADPDRADVIVTAIHTRPRLERHIQWEVAKTKPIVNPDWLRDSINSRTIQPCGRYAALSALSDQTQKSCPKVAMDTPTVGPSETLPIYHGQHSIPTDPESGVKDTDLAAMNYLSHFSCQRSSPLICPNQSLVEELDIIRRARLYEGEERSMLSYARAIASIKAYPYRFNDQTALEDVVKLPYLGTKLTSMVKEFIETGNITEAQKLLSSARFLALSAFNSVHGIGPHTARHLYSLGLQTIEDLNKYYEVTPGMIHESIQPLSHSKEVGVEKSIQISLALRHDFSQKIPREEVEEINQVIMRELESIEAGCKSIIAGGYRRGKQESNDADIVISHTDWDHGANKVRGLCKKLVQRLHERGFVKHVLNMSGYHPPNVFRTHHWDSLEKALTVFVLPRDSTCKQTYRRVDLIFVTPGAFWTAIVGWTGSTMFERDLRLWAKQEKGLKFDSSGITRQHNSELFLPKTERGVFELLGLPYVHPTLRNADV